MVTVQHTITDPSGNPRAGVRVVVELTLPAWRDHARVLFALDQVTDTQGRVVYDLISNTNLIPEGTVYVLTSDADPEPIRFVVPADGGPYDVRTLLDDPPAAVDQSALAAHVLDPSAHAFAAALAAHEALPHGGDADITAHDTSGVAHADIRALVSAHETATDPHAVYATGAEVSAAVAAHEATQPHSTDPVSVGAARADLGDWQTGDMTWRPAGGPNPQMYRARVPASPGDLLIILAAVLSAGTDGETDAATLVGGVPTRWASSGTSTQRPNGWGGGYQRGQFPGGSLVMWLVVQAGDLEDGYATVQLYARSSANAVRDWRAGGPSPGGGAYPTGIVVLNAGALSV